mgnify:CR=1 FL=1
MNFADSEKIFISRISSESDEKLTMESLKIDLDFLATHRDQLQLENLVSLRWVRFIKQKLGHSKQHNLSNEDVFQFFKNYKIVYNTHSFLHHSYMRCRLLSFKGSLDSDQNAIAMPTVESEQQVIAVIDVFGYFIAFDDAELNFKEFLNNKRTQKETENQRS